MRPTRAAVALVALIVAACTSAPLADPTAERSPSPPAIATESSTPTGPTSPSYTPASAAATASNATPLPTAFGASIFTDPDDCTNPDLGYRVAYPASWYSNAAVTNPLNAAGEGLSACWLFAPTDFAVVYGTEISAEVAIVIRVFELPAETDWNYGPFPNRRVLSDSATTVASLPARRQEYEITERDIAFMAGDLQTKYVIQLGDGSYLVAETYRGPDYELAKSVLDQMVQTLDVEVP